MPKRSHWLRNLLLALICVSMAGAATRAQAQMTPTAAPTSTVDIHTLAPVNVARFDPQKATDAYLARVSGEARAKSDSYFEGGYWLLLVDALYGIVVSALLLFARISARMRNFAQGITRSRFWQVPIYIVQYFILTTVVTLPLTIYEGFIREHAYGLSNQNFLQWSGDQGIELAVSLVAFVIIGTLIYAAIRASRQFWWVWGTGIVIAFMIVGAVIYPVFIAPLLNHYYPLKDGPLKVEILSLARAEGVPAQNVYEFDASKQSKRISANVSGFLGTTRISLNDNLINRSSEREIIAVLGHEMGHYVLDHVVYGVVLNGLLFLVLFGLTAWGFNALVAIFGGIWDVRAVDDPAGLPVLILVSTVLALLTTPVQNTITRTIETQADIFGVNAVRQPDGFALATLQLSEYRKLDPSPLEEFVFYDHPSGRTRILMMMRWKAEHLHDADIEAGPVSPQ